MSLGELSAREMFVRGIVRLGNCPLGNYLSGNCPSRKFLWGTVHWRNVRRGKTHRGKVCRGTVQILFDCNTSLEVRSIFLDISKTFSKFGIKVVYISLSVWVSLGNFMIFLNTAYLLDFKVLF